MERFHYNGEISELVKWFKIGLVTGLGPQKIRKLLFDFDSLDKIYSAPNLQLLQTGVFNQNMLNEFNKLKQASDENFIKIIEECKDKNIQIITFLDEKYPQELKVLQSPPLTLYLKGNIDLLYQKNKIAIVGTREPSQKAIDYTYSLSNSLASKDYIIVSGGALGIDTAAHKGALDFESGKTICVLGAGFNYIYPPENITLFNEIEKIGLLISEHLPTFRGSNISYLQRNRITSGLSDAVFLVGAKEIGGSLTQVKIAYDQRKPIFCPKQEDNILPSDGVKYAISKYNAKEVSNPDDLIRKLKNPFGSFI